jgi:hypothetical protein
MSKSRNEAAAEAAAQARREHVAALEKERAGYEQLGQRDRVKLVDEQIELYSKEPKARTATAPDTADSAPAAPTSSTSSNDDASTAPATPPAKKAAANKAPAKKAAANKAPAKKAAAAPPKA